MTGSEEVNAPTAPHQRPERLRPRRLEADTISYVKEVAETLSQSGEDLDEESTQLLLWNVLEELAPRAASASSDRHTGELIETFLPRMTAGQLRYFLSKMDGYYSHLWTNRYSSHVLQHVLSRASAVVAQEVAGDQDQEDDDDKEEDERLRETPSMNHLIVNMVNEVESEWLTLMNDVSASHVLRAVLAVLAGQPLLPEKRGKKGKHRTIVFTTPSTGEATAVASFAIPASFTALFQQLLRRVRRAPRRDLQSLLFDPNSGPVLAMAIRVSAPKARQKLIEHVLQWDDQEASAQVFYELAGDAVTSHFLETVMSHVDDAFFAALFHRCLQTRLLEFAQHALANYVVQHALQRVTDRALAREVLQELDGALWTLLVSGRSGVVWRLVEMSRRLNVETRHVVTSLVEAVQKQEAKKPEAVRKPFVAALLALQLATADGGKLHLNVLGAKMIGELLQLEYADWLAEPLYRGILALNTAQLTALAMDSTGSRCVIEPLWETTDEARAWVRRALFDRFVGQFSALALNRLGAFSVIKCYETLAVKDKAVVAQELLQVEGKLAGSHFAQLVVNTVNLYEFRNNRAKWEAQYEKKDKIADMFKDVVQEEEGEEGEEEGESKKKKKRSKKEKKAKTHKKKISVVDGEEEEERNSRKRKAVESSDEMVMIMDALRTSGGQGKTKTKSKSKKSKRSADE